MLIVAARASSGMVLRPEGILNYDVPRQTHDLTNRSSLRPDSTFNFYSARNARIASAVLATAIPSVRPSVRHTPVWCQNGDT